MTNQEAIEEIKKLEYYGRPFDNSLEECNKASRKVMALNMAIKALEQEPSGDLIRRQAVLETLDDMDNALDEDRTVENYKELLKECYEVLPSVNPQKNIVNNGTMNITL